MVVAIPACGNRTWTDDSKPIDFDHNMFKSTNQIAQREVDYGHLSLYNQKVRLINFFFFFFSS